MITFYKKNSLKNYLATGLIIIATSLFTKNGFAAAPVKAGSGTTSNGLVVNYSYQDNLCANDNFGTITINTVNGLPFSSFSYQWTDNPTFTTNKRINLPGNTIPYTVEITDLSDPSKKGNLDIFITSPPSISISTGSRIDTQCSGQPNGATNISVSGGTPPFNYSWVKRGTTSPIVSTLLNFTGASGRYTVTVTDANNCTQSLNYDIEDAPVFIQSPPTKTDNVEFTDLNGKITINVAGGSPSSGLNPYTYQWSFNGVVNPAYTGKTQSNLPSGVYSVIIKDGNSCPTTQIINIEPLALLVVAPTSTNSTCKSTPNGSIALNVTGGKAPYSIKWNDLAVADVNTTRTGLDAGTYAGTLTDALGAIRIISPQIITSPTLIDFQPVTHTDNKCFGETAGTITLKVSGGILPYRYVLNGAAPVAFAGNTFTIPNLASGSYTVSIIDDGNCATTPPQSLDILPLNALRFSAPASVFDVRCSDPNSGKIEVFVDGGLPPYTYQWSNDATNNTNKNLNLPNGSYTLKVIDALLCELNYTVNILTSAAPITLSESTLPGKHVDNVCFLNPDLTPQRNGKTTVDIVGGTPPFVATWLFNNLPITLVDNDPLLLRSISVSNLASGTYTLLIRDNIGCEPTPLILTIEPVELMKTNPVIVNQKCVGVNNASITLNPSGGTQFPLPQAPYRYNWASPIPVAERGNSTVSNLAPGTYRVTIQDSENCPLDTTFIIDTAIPVIQVDTAVIVKSNTCNGASPNGSIKITIAGGAPPYTYKWDLADPATGIIIPDALPLATRLPGQRIEDDLRQNLDAGYYVVTVTDSNLCETQLPALEPSKPKTFQIIPVNCKPDNPNITPDPLMSPNGDGLGNDFFYIEGIEKFPDNQVIIYNRWGNEVFNINGYNNLDKVFVAVANSALTNTKSALVDGVYYYTIRTIFDNRPRINKGFIIIKR